jgi:hypothetical protein
MMLRNFTVASGCASTGKRKPMDDKTFANILIVLALAAYFFPALVAARRKHHNQNSVFVVNLFLGWTFIGWVVALVWAVSAIPPEHRVQGRSNNAPPREPIAPPSVIAPQQKPSAFARWSAAFREPKRPYKQGQKMQKPSKVRQPNRLDRFFGEQAPWQEGDNPYRDGTPQAAEWERQHAPR